MTAEVGVMNRLGVALAADSAVTIGRDADKIYTSADKLFQLSHGAPVGVMIHGNADFVGLPWETIVKEYRRHLGGERFDALEEYAASFFKFLAGNRDMFPRAQQEESILNLVYSLLMHVRDGIEEVLSEKAEEQDGLEEGEIAPIVSELIRERLRLIKSQQYLPHFSASRRVRIKKQLREKLVEAKKAVFGNLPITSGASRQLTSIAEEMLYRQYFGPLQSGIVFAGFGEKAYMPKLFAYDVEEMVDNLPRAYIANKEEITLRNSASIIPFAQREMVDSFLRGIDQELDRSIRSSTNALFRGAVEGILGVVHRADVQVAAQIRKAVEPEVQKLLKSLFSDWDDRSARYWMPIVDIVSSLPKDELASMAESLVNLTKFKRRVTPERETVGGPIDVAVITKGDGFVWVKRKHYFTAELNPRVISRYGREE